MIAARFLNDPFFVRQNPFHDLNRIKQDMDRLTSAFFGGRGNALGSGVFPAINVTEDKETYRVRAELPGLKVEDLDISVTGRNLTVSGQRKIEGEGNGARYHRREREAGKFSRAVTLPGDIDTDKVSASLTDGILTIVMPKAESAKPKQITVK